MADVWIGYTTILETVMARMNQLCLQDRDRSAITDKLFSMEQGTTVDNEMWYNRCMQAEQVSTVERLDSAAMHATAAAHFVSAWHSRTSRRLTLYAMRQN